MQSRPAILVFSFSSFLLPPTFTNKATFTVLIQNFDEEGIQFREGFRDGWSWPLSVQ